MEIKRAGRGGVSAGRMMPYYDSTGFLYVCRLRTLRALHDLKLDEVSFLQSAVAVADDRGIVDKDVRTVVTPNEPVAL
jgi:hypothetical protein